MINDRPADPIDESGETSQLFLDADIKRVRDAAAPQAHPEFDGVHCVGLWQEPCGEEIPAARLALGRVRCVACQEVIDAHAKQYRR